MTQEQKRTTPKKNRNDLILEILSRNPGLEHHFSDIAGDMLFAEERDRDGEEAVKSRTTSALARMASEGGQGVFRTQAGTYIYFPDKADGGQPDDENRAPEYPSLFEHIGFGRDGGLLLRADDGSLWRAEPAGTL